MDKCHRDAIRQRMLDGEMNTFEDYEKLDALLTYAIPNKDTTEIARRLIDEFGSLSGVFDANPDLLKEFDGINDNAVALIKAVPQLLRVYCKHRCTLDATDLQSLKRFAISQYIGETSEVFKIICLDDSKNYVSCVNVSDAGSPNSVPVDFKKVVDMAEKYESSNIILMHNHPTDDPLPSSNDKSITNYAKRLFSEIGITLIEHVVVSRDTVAFLFHSEIGIDRL
jgi:DNA repair protein RadC